MGCPRRSTRHAGHQAARRMPDTQPTAARDKRTRRALPRGGHQTGHRHHHPRGQRYASAQRPHLLHDHQELHPLRQEDSGQGALCRCEERNDYGRRHHCRAHGEHHARLHGCQDH